MKLLVGLSLFCVLTSSTTFAALVQDPSENLNAPENVASNVISGIGSAAQKIENLASATALTDFLQKESKKGPDSGFQKLIEAFGSDEELKKLFASTEIENLFSDKVLENLYSGKLPSAANLEDFDQFLAETFGVNKEKMAGLRKESIEVLKKLHNTNNLNFESLFGSLYSRDEI